MPNQPNSARDYPFWLRQGTMEEMRRIFRQLLFLVLLLGAAAASAGDAPAPDSPYLSLLSSYQQRFEKYVLAVFRKIVSEEKLPAADRELLLASVSRFEEANNAAFARFRLDYQKAFLQAPPDSAALKEARFLERNLKWASEVAQFELIKIVELLRGRGRPMAMRQHLANLDRLSGALARDQRIKEPLQNYLANLVPRKQRSLRTMAGALKRFALNTNISELLRWMPPEPFTSQTAPPTLTMLKAGGASTELAKLPENAVIILAMNHDIGTLDGLAIQSVANAFGSETNMILTTKGAWPQLKFFKNADPDVFLTDEKGFAAKVLERFRQEGTGRISFSVFPEGGVALTGAQLPLFSNSGAFKIARDAAHDLQGKKPVYYVQLTSNLLEHVTSDGKIPMHIEIREPELVPDTAVLPNDRWIAARRAEFEVAANRNRFQLMDIEKAEPLPGTRLYRMRDTRGGCAAEYSAVSGFR
jgi:hypothetical protein